MHTHAHTRVLQKGRGSELEMKLEAKFIKCIWIFTIICLGKKD